MTRILVLAVLFAAVAGCSHREEIPKITREEYEEVQRHFPWGGEPWDADYFASAKGRQLVAKRLRQMFGDLGLSTMKGATRVETLKIIDPSWHPIPGHRVGDIEGFPILAKGRDQGQEFASKLSDRILDGKLYFYSRSCFEDPGVAYRLWKGSDSFSLIICYECYHLQVFVRDAGGRLVHRSRSFFRDPFGGPDVLRELAKQALPSDAEIQAL